jgi:hypothetical protein
MRPSPSIVPGIDRDTYLILDDLARLGCAWRETSVADTELESVVNDLLEGQYSNPIRVVGFNTAEGWSRDVSEDVARESCPSSCMSSWSGTSGRMRACSCRCQSGAERGLVQSTASKAPF